MVEYEDPITGKTLSYHIAKTLRRQWAKLMNGELEKKDEDRIYIVDGRERCQPKGSKVLMANGEWKNIENIKIGDEILSPQEDGTHIFSKVTDTCDWFDEETYDVVELNRSKQKLYSCSHNHLIPMNYKTYPREKLTEEENKLSRKEKFEILQNKKRLNGEWKIKHYEAQEYSKLSIHTKKNITSLSSFAIEKYKDRENCEIEPYTLGIWLGDGHFCDNQIKKENPKYGKETIVKQHFRNFKDGSIFLQKEHTMNIEKQEYRNIHYRSLGITSQDKCILDEISKFYTIMSIVNKKETKCKTYRFSNNGKLAKQLTELDLNGKNSGTKFIPKEALLSDLEYRKRLLAGLIDSDGYYDPKGGYGITLKSKELIEGIKELVYSIGGRCGKIRKVTKKIKKINFEGTYYSISFYLGDMKLPLQLKRKIKDNSCFYLSSNRTAIDVIKNTGKQVYGFELDSKSKWYITDNWMVTHNTGKSLFTLQQAKFLDKTFTVDRVCFTPEEFLHQIRTAPKGSVVVFDEAFRGLSSKGSQSKVNKVIVQSMMECGQRNLIIFIVLPTFFLLELYAAVLRSNALFHVYKDKSGRRAFKTYNYQKKSHLYREGKKKGFSYALPRVSAKATGGRFYNIYPINEQEYRKKKGDSLKDMDPGMNSRDKSATDSKNNLVVALYHKMKADHPEITIQKVADELTAMGNPIKKQYLSELIIKHREIDEKLSERMEMDRKLAENL